MMSEKSYYEIRIETPKEVFDLIPYVFDQSLNLSFLEGDGAWLTAVDSSAELQKVREHLKDLEKIYYITYTIHERKQENWNALWEQSVGTVDIPGFVEIYPSFLKPQTEAEYYIEITPQNAFGTGHHATTFLMMKLMEEIDFKDKEVLDFGCGTGILGILACKMGARKVEFIDNDYKCIANVKQNLKLNHITNDVNAHIGSHGDLHQASYDIILANVYSSVLIEAAKYFKDSATHILLSGIRPEEVERVIDAYHQYDFVLRETLIKDNWAASHISLF